MDLAAAIRAADATTAAWNSAVYPAPQPTSSAHLCPADQEAVAEVGMSQVPKHVQPYCT